MPVYKKNRDKIIWPQCNLAYTRFMNSASWFLHP